MIDIPIYCFLILSVSKTAWFPVDRSFIPFSSDRLDNSTVTNDAAAACQSHQDKELASNCSHTVPDCDCLYSIESHKITIEFDLSNAVSVCPIRLMKLDPILFCCIFFFNCHS